MNTCKSTVQYYTNNCHKIAQKNNKQNLRVYSNCTAKSYTNVLTTYIATQINNTSTVNINITI